MKNNRSNGGRSRKRLSAWIVCLMIAALTLTGAVPSFAAKSGDSSEQYLTPEGVTYTVNSSIDWSDAPEVEGTSVIMIDAGNGATLYEKNSRELRDPASITKILTCLVALENLDLDEEITVEEQPSADGNDIGIKEGETLTTEQLMYAMMLESANDAAEVLAVAVGGDIETFCDMMNEKAKECGAENTSFSNPNGLTKSGQNHKTTAYDIAMIAREAMKNDDFRKIVQTEKYTIPATKYSDPRELETTNPCLGLYEGTTGIKTGTTNAAGYCFCGSAKKGDTELIVVDLNSGEEERFSETIKLWDYGFSKYYTYTAVKAGKTLGEFDVKRGSLREVAAGTNADLDVTLEQGFDSDNISVKTTLDEELTAPVKKGEKIGTVTVSDKNGDVLVSAPLVSLEEADEGGILSYIGIADEDRLVFLLLLLFTAALLAGIGTVLRKLKYKKFIRRRAKRQRSVRRKEREKEKHPFDSDV